MSARVYDIDTPARVIGRLDIRALTLKPLMAARMDRCARKGFDAADADNVEA